MSRRSVSPAEERYTLFRHDPADRFACFYCGEPASTVDHCPPISRVDDYRALRLRREAYVKVPCCEECNSVLGASLQEDIVERERVLKRRLEYRYRKLIDTPDWSDGEMDRKEVRGDLRTLTEAWQRRKDWLSARLDYGRGVSAVLDLLDEPGSPFHVTALPAADVSPLRACAVCSGPLPMTDARPRRYCSRKCVREANTVRLRAARSKR